MAESRKIEQVVPGVPGEYYATLESPSGGDSLLLAFEGGGNINDISVEAVGSTDVDCDLYLRYPSSAMRNVLGTDIVPAAGDSWSLNDAASKGKMWYRIPSGAVLEIYVNSVTTTGSLDLLAIVS